MVRCRFVLFFDHTDDFRQFIHQLGAVLQPPGCVDHQNIIFFIPRLGDRVVDKTGGVRAKGG